MVHEPSGVVRADGVDGLFQAQRGHRNDGQNLSLAPGEQPRAVGAGQDAGVACDRPDLIQCTAVRTNMLLQDAASNGLPEHGLEAVADGVLGVVVFKRFSYQRGDLVFAVVHLIHAGVAGEQVAPAGADDLFDLGDDGFGAGLVVVGFNLGLADFSGKLFNHVDGGGICFLRLADGLQDHLFGDLVGAGFNHQDGVTGAADHHAERALLALLIGRMNDVFAADVGDTAGGDGSVEGNLGDGDCG